MVRSKQKIFRNLAKHKKKKIHLKIHEKFKMKKINLKNILKKTFKKKKKKN